MNNIDNEIKKNYKTLQKIKKGDYGKDLKANSKNNVRGALTGGAIGVVIGLFARKNIMITGLIGLIIGRLIIKQK